MQLCPRPRESEPLGSPSGISSLIHFPSISRLLRYAGPLPWLPRDQILHPDPDSVPDAEAPLLPWTSTESLPVSLLDLGAGLAEGFPGWGRASLVTQMVKNPPAMQDTWV